jgi:8-oxo-dGTP pyrophosphatase MutT (NUDIX family)
MTGYLTTLSQADITRLLADKDNNPPFSQYKLHSFYSRLKLQEPSLAAVLVPFHKEDDEWHILFTRRNVALAKHSGQVSFPGGRSEPGDNNPEETALRETFEEIGIIPWPYSLQLTEDEVSRVFSIPLNWLANPDNYQIRKRTLPEPYEPLSVVYYKPFENEILWGATARIVLSLLKILLQNKNIH